MWIYLNGNEWAKQQAAKRGIAFKPLDNGFPACEDQAALAGICASLQASDVRAFSDRWQSRLPSPFTVKDRERGYGYALAFRQLEISDTRVFDRPASGRAWFEQTLAFCVLARVAERSRAICLAFAQAPATWEKAGQPKPARPTLSSC